MPRNTLESITYQHVLFGAGTILAGRSSMRAAPIQPEDLEKALTHARSLIELPWVGDQPAPPDGEYDTQRASSDLQEVLDLYNATVIDGRFIDELPRNPKSVASRLGRELSESAAVAIENATGTVAGQFGDSFALSGGKKIVAVVIVAVIAIRAESRPYEIVIDSSGLVKV